MAEPPVSINMENVELKTARTSKNTECSYVSKQFLSIEEVSSILTATKHKRPLKENETKMTEYLEMVKDHHFQHMQVSLPIRNLQHVTRLFSMFKICEEGGFRANVRKHNQESCSSESEELRPELDDLIFWSAGISSEDTETAKSEAYNKVRSVNPSSNAQRFEREIMKQFANSPAFREASRYGNFRFSFPLSHLLEMYKEQHCGGGEPQLRILSIELHKQEIAHYIVVHSPSTSKFNDFPEVPTVQSDSDPLPFVYWMDETLYWRPESTSDALIVEILKDGRVRKKCYKSCGYSARFGHCDHKIFSVWNSLIFAFHLPEDQLDTPIEHLRENLTACAGDEPFLGGKPLNIEEAKKYVEIVKDRNTVISSTNRENVTVTYSTVVLVHRHIEYYMTHDMTRPEMIE